MIFEQEEAGEGQVPPEAAPLEVICEAQERHHEGGAGVEGQGGSLDASDEVIADRFAMLPPQHVGAEAFVGETFDGVRKGVLGGFEIDEIGLGCRVADWVVHRHLVRMLESGQSSEFRFYLFLFRAWGQTEVLVKVSTHPHDVVCFVESV